MTDVLTWGALIAASGSLIAIITFWMNRGKAEANALSLSEGATKMAGMALSKVDALAVQFADSRLEFVRDFASHKDLAASETRYATALDGLRVELRGMNERLDRIIEGFINK